MNTLDQIIPTNSNANLTEEVRNQVVSNMNMSGVPPEAMSQIHQAVTGVPEPGAAIVPPASNFAPLELNLTATPVDMTTI